MQRRYNDFVISFHNRPKVSESPVHSFRFGLLFRIRVVHMCVRLPSVIIPDSCETFRVQYESCNNSLYKFALSPL